MVQLLAKNMATKKFEIKNEYSENKEGTKKKEHKKKNHKKEMPPRKKDEPIENEVDSDGFEIVGTKEEKKQKRRDENQRE